MILLITGPLRERQFFFSRHTVKLSRIEICLVFQMDIGGPLLVPEGKTAPVAHARSKAVPPRVMLQEIAADFPREGIVSRCLGRKGTSFAISQKIWETRHSGNQVTQHPLFLFGASCSRRRRPGVSQPRGNRISCR